MFEIVLFQPEIAPNTGNVIRLAANTGARLHLVRPLGFVLEDKGLRRAGLDYHDLAQVMVHEDWAACRAWLGTRRRFLLTSKGVRPYADVAFAAGDVFVFGSETRGVPSEVAEGFAEASRLRIPMLPGNRSLNLSNAVALVVYEAWRQQGFAEGL